MRITVGWLVGTYLLFLGVGQTSQVTNLGKLTIFVASTIVVFILGYKAKLRGYAGSDYPQAWRFTPTEIKSSRRWILASSAYFAVYGLTLLQLYGATSVTGIVAALFNPGDAYQAKFVVFEAQALGGDNAIIQTATLLAVLSTPMVPLVVLYWRNLTVAIRIAAIVGGGIYVSYFVFVGTFKGLGDFLIYGLAAALVLRKGAWNGHRNEQRKASRLTKVGAILAIAIFLAYMVYAQSSRLETFGVDDNKFRANPIIAKFVGPDVARGVSVTASYPTQGYVGLAYNLDTPFEWTYGRGASRALESYWTQYIGPPSIAGDTYPARTEKRTGWPAGQNWSTIYPWLASDLTMYGAIGFMGVLGWWLARFWYEAAFRRDRLAVLLFAQLALLIAFIPANNQIGQGRVSLVAFVSLAVLWTVTRRRRPAQTSA